MEKRIATLKVSVAYFPNSHEADLSWESLDTHEEVRITVPIDDEAGTKLAGLVPCCVYHYATSKE